MHEEINKLEKVSTTHCIILIYKLLSCLLIPFKKPSPKGKKFWSSKICCVNLNIHALEEKYLKIYIMFSLGEFHFEGKKHSHCEIKE